MPVCTLPYIPWLREWYNREFKELCQLHDERYKQQSGKRHADLEFMVGITLKGYPTLAFLSYISVSTIGIINYWKAGQRLKRNK